MNTIPEPNLTQNKTKGRLWLYILPILALLLLTLILVLSEAEAPEQKVVEIPTDIPKSSGPLEVLLYEDLPELVSERFPNDWRLVDIHFNEDSSQVLLWLGESDPIGDVYAREPLIILATLNESKMQWSLIPATDSEFGEVMMMSDFAETELADSIFTNAVPKAPTGVVYGGYYLPWPTEQTKRVTWSISHASCTPRDYCYYAFDFADGTMFDIVAAKGGYVYHWRDTCANNNKTCMNSITIEDRTTSPWTYNIYLHLAQHTIPEYLKTKGRYVSSGEFLGKADNTGPSTGHHLHFMVVEQSTLTACKFYCFGKAVDITFRDVDINWHAPTKGGRPRLPNEAEQYGGQGRTYYTSENVHIPIYDFQFYLFPVYK